jgi:hypothetical protein
VPLQPEPAAAATTVAEDNPWYFSFVNQLATGELRKMPLKPVLKPTRQIEVNTIKCPHCQVIRVGGGYLVAGCGEYCIGCNNKVDIQVGGGVHSPPGNTLAELTQEALLEVASKIMSETVANLVNEISTAEKAMEAEAARLLKQAMDAMLLEDRNRNHETSRSGTASVTDATKRNGMSLKNYVVFTSSH